MTTAETMPSIWPSPIAGPLSICHAMRWAIFQPFCRASLASLPVVSTSIPPTWISLEVAAGWMPRSPSICASSRAGPIGQHGHGERQRQPGQQSGDGPGAGEPQA